MTFFLFFLEFIIAFFVIFSFVSVVLFPAVFFIFSDVFPIFSHGFPICSIGSKVYLFGFIFSFENFCL